MDSMSLLLTELTVDPFHLEAFLRDPDPLATAMGLTAADIPRLMLSVKSAPFGKADGSWARCASCSDPGHDPLPDPDIPSPEPNS